MVHVPYGNGPMNPGSLGRRRADRVHTPRWCCADPGRQAYCAGVTAKTACSSDVPTVRKPLGGLAYQGRSSCSDPRNASIRADVLTRDLPGVDHKDVRDRLIGLGLACRTADTKIAALNTQSMISSHLRQADCRLGIRQNNICGFANGVFRFHRVGTRPSALRAHPPGEAAAPVAKIRQR